MTSFLKLIGVLIFGAACAVFVMFAWIWFVMFFLGFIGLFFFIWMVGVPIKVTKNIDGKKVTIGHLRWTKFYPAR